MRATRASPLANVVIPALLVITPVVPAWANCTSSGSPPTFTCDTTSPNPFASTIGTGPSQASGTVVNVLSNAQVSTGNANAIELADNGSITLQPNAVVKNFATNAAGLYSSGGDTIEIRNNNTLTIGVGAQVLSLGTQTTAEAVNPQGTGNLITNNGTIMAANANAIFFNNTSGLNTVVNNPTGIIQTTAPSGNVIGGFGTAAVRAIVETQKALKADPSLAAAIGGRLFPPDEAPLIADLIARDAPFYRANISPEAVDGLNRFAEAVGLISEPVPYERMVASQFRQLWNE